MLHVSPEDRRVRRTFDNRGRRVTIQYGRVMKFAPDGTGSIFATLPPDMYGSGDLKGIACDAAGNVYVAEVNASLIYKLTPEGVQSVFATAGLGNPVGLGL